MVFRVQPFESTSCASLIDHLCLGSHCCSTAASFKAEVVLVTEPGGSTGLTQTRSFGISLYKIWKILARHLHDVLAICGSHNSICQACQTLRSCAFRPFSREFLVVSHESIQKPAKIWTNHSFLLYRSRVSLLYSTFRNRMDTAAVIFFCGKMFLRVPQSFTMSFGARDLEELGPEENFMYGFSLLVFVVLAPLTVGSPSSCHTTGGKPRELGKCTGKCLSHLGFGRNQTNLRISYPLNKDRTD